MKTLVFVVEDDPLYARFISHSLSMNPDFEIEVFSSGKDCLENLHRKPVVVTLDYHLPDTEGQLILQRIREKLPDCQVIVISGQHEIEVAVELLKQGAYDYLVKNEDTHTRLFNVVQKAVAHSSLKSEVEQLRKEVRSKYDVRKSLIGNSPGLEQVIRMIEKAAANQIVVSVTGETGTGKEVVARAIHFRSGRYNKPFVAINMSAIPSELMESELFGHEKGAFTGAQQARAGAFEQAQGGTLFLDEIGDLDFSLQAKLLRVLQEKELKRVGGNQVLKLDVRIIVATHKNLLAEVEQKRFREDLYYRLAGIPIQLPPLRERGDDMGLLAEFFLQQFVKENNLNPVSIGNEAMEKLKTHTWPGNIRELKSVIELAAVMCEADTIGADDVSFHTQADDMNLLDRDLTLEEYTRIIIRHQLKKHNNNVVETARKLGIGKTTLYDMLKRT